MTWQQCTTMTKEGPDDAVASSGLWYVFFFLFPIHFSLLYILLTSVFIGITTTTAARRDNSVQQWQGKAQTMQSHRLGYGMFFFDSLNYLLHLTTTMAAHDATTTTGPNDAFCVIWAYVFFLNSHVFFYSNRHFIVGICSKRRITRYGGKWEVGWWKRAQTTCFASFGP